MPAEKMTFEQALQQSRSYYDAANEISKFRSDNFLTLSLTRRQSLAEDSGKLRDISDSLLNDATDILWDNLQPNLKNIRDATDKMRVVRAHLKNVQRVLSFASVAINLGTTILTGNPVAIASASLTVVATINNFRDEDDAEALAEADTVG